MQGGLTTFGAMHHLRGQSGFWEALSDCLPEHSQRQLELEDSSDLCQDWLQRSHTTWRFYAESAALQIISLEAYRQPRPEKGQSISSPEKFSQCNAWEYSALLHCHTCELGFSCMLHAFDRMSVRSGLGRHVMFCVLQRNMLMYLP